VVACSAYRFDRCIAVNEGWGELLSTTERPDAEDLAETRTGAAMILARLGRAEVALQMLSAAPVALDRAPAWVPGYTAMACDAAATLWLAERTDHAECIERNLRDKVIAADFRYPMEDSRLALARLSALQRRYDEAAEWFARARVVLDEQGARPLRAIVDYDEALMYVRRGATGDAQRATPLLDAALAQFRDIGMPGWIRCAEHLLRERTEWKPAAQPEDQPLSFDSPQDRPGPLLDKEDKERADSPAAEDVCGFRREGEYWTLAYRGKTVRLRDTKGLSTSPACSRSPAAICTSATSPR
jgi:tetratricopeptide (TPR) repeat protein